MRGYVVCSTPRSGSNFLCQLAESTGRLGRPREYFNGPARRALDDPSFPDAPAEQVQRILRDGTSANGVYALKAFPTQWRAAAACVPLTSMLPELRFVRLTRQDLLGQAISWAIAQHTRQFRSTQPANGEPTYDSQLIFGFLRSIALLEADWSVFFARTGLQSLHLTYENVESEPQTCVDRLAEWMEIEPAPIDWSRIDLRIQRDAVNEAWRRRFLEEHGAPDALYPATFFRPNATT